MHRHNVGFMAVDAIARVHGFGPWKARFSGVTAEGRLGEAKVVLLKPMTFMNESGRSVGEALRFFKLEPAALTVFHDELDLEPFRVKVKTGGGAAGQNGLRSIIAHVGADFRRVRIGIGHPGHKDRVTPHVLGNFAKAEERLRDALLADLADLAPLIAAGEDARFMNDLALRQNAV
jgi:PTH1 family peptidyl-tRNA hydrolase